MVAADSLVDFTEEVDSVFMGYAPGEGSGGGRVPKQLEADDDVVVGAPGELLVLLALRIGLVVPALAPVPSQVWLEVPP